MTDSGYPIIVGSYFAVDSSATVGNLYFILTVPLEPHDAAVPLEGEHVGRRFMRGVQGRVTRTRR